MVVQKSIGLVKEFKEFLREYKVIGLAIAVIMGLAANQLVKSLVDNVVMPIISVLIPGGAWREAVLTLGPILIKWGQFLSDLIYFLIVAWVILMIAKLLLKEEKVGKK